MSFQNLWTNMFKSQSSASASSDNQLHETSNSPAMRPPHSEGVSRPNCGQERERERSPPKAKRRWNPKREQIQILEDILNSGRVSPSKEEIKKIRTQLEKFGQVTEASVFYWFQNRKSKSKAKRRQHQLQAAAQISKSGTEAGTLSSSSPASTTTTSSSVQSKAITNLASSPVNSMQNNIGNQPPSPFDVPVSSFVGHQFNLQVNEEISANQYSDMQAIRKDLQVNEEMSLNQYNNMQQAIGGAGAGAVGGQGILNDGTGGVQEEPIINANPSITVFINDIPVEVPMGPINFRAFFGDNSVLIHSSGQSVLVNEWGFTTEGLEHGAIYFLF